MSKRYQFIHKESGVQFTGSDDALTEYASKNLNLSLVEALATGQYYIDEVKEKSRSMNVRNAIDTLNQIALGDPEKGSQITLLAIEDQPSENFDNVGKEIVGISHSEFDGAIVYIRVRGMEQPSEPRIIDDSVDDILRIPPVKWRNYVGDLSSPERNTLSRNLSGLACSLARAEGYVSYCEQNSGEIEDGTHREAVKYSNKRTAKVRKALGYSYSKDDITF